jgi:hypothetical protein
LFVEERRPIRDDFVKLLARRWRGGSVSQERFDRMPDRFGEAGHRIVAPGVEEHDDEVGKSSLFECAVSGLLELVHDARSKK